MDRLRALRIFIAVAEHASFAEAARRLAMSPSSVSRAVAALEASLGTQLLMRTTRSVRLTEAGAAFLARCQSGIAEIDDAFERANGGGATPRGTLTVTAPVVFGRVHILPVVLELLARYPELRIRLLLVDRVIRLVEEGVDIAVRIGELPDSALHRVQIGEVRRMLAASPAYLSGRGAPASSSALRGHDLIAVEDTLDPHHDWMRDPGSRARATPRLSVNSVDAAIAAAVAGLGIVPALSYQISDHLAAGRLERVLPDAPAPALPVSLLFQSGRHDRPNIRAFVDLARRRLNGSIV